MPRKSATDRANREGSARLEPKLVRAAKNGSIQEVQQSIAEARRHGPIQAELLTSVLLKACEQGHADIAQYLILQGAKTTFQSGSRFPPLLRAIDHGHVGIVELLIAHGSDLDVRDKKGRTALMTAAWRNHASIVSVLLSKGALVQATDHEKRHVFHNLAADKSCPNYDKVIGLLLWSEINLEAKDELGRTPLHWAAATGNLSIARELLERKSGPPSNIHACDIRTKTPLHFAAAHGHTHMVKILLEHNADPRARSDGYWTPLHNACEKGTVDLVNLLLDKGVDVNSMLLNGRTPLHVAAEAGNAPVALRLLQHPDIKQSVKDRFGDTPLLRAAQTAFAGRKDIIELLSPWNNVEALSQDALDACHEFKAAIVDFGNYHNGNKVTRKSVHDLLYARDANDRSKHAVSTIPTKVKATHFRWIHLPANNVAWCDALLTKRFIEEGAIDVEGFKALERSFSHQHRGQQHHSHFMRPLCQVEPRGPIGINRPANNLVLGSPNIVVNGPVHVVNEPSRLSATPEAPNDQAISGATPTEAVGASRNDGPTSNATPTPRRSSKDTQTDARQSKPRRKPTRTSTTDSRGTLSSAESGRNLSDNNIYMFMPYLHFETNRRRHEMRNVIEAMHNANRQPARSHDEKLLRAHLTASSSVLHIRRTLDQFFYHNIDTKSRDDDQVVHRYQQSLRGNKADADAKVVMVDQLWMWILGKDLVVTAFPQRWQQPPNDPLNVLEGLIQDINSKTREPVQNVFELASLITGRCLGTFDRHKKGDDDFQLIDMFEASIGNVMDAESTLFKEFKIASRQASRWLQQHQRPIRLARNLDKAQKWVEIDEEAYQGVRLGDDGHAFEPHFVDKLLDIGQETDLLAEIKDVRDELMIMRIILENQEQVLPDLERAFKAAYKEDHRSYAQMRKLQRGFEEHDKNISNPIKDIVRMDKQAERIYNSIISLLDLKQKHANAFEARFARDQAAGTARQGQTIMVFTIVTVIFLPLTFIAAFFTMNISNFPHNDSGDVEVSLSYVSTYVFGIGIAISIPCVIVALSVDQIGTSFNEGWLWLRRAFREFAQRRKAHQVQEVEILAMQKTLSVSKSMRRSAEVNWMDIMRSPVRSTDIERGHIDRVGSASSAAHEAWQVKSR